MNSHRKTHSQYENTLNFTGTTVKMVKTVNVQEGQQYIITPHHHSTNSLTTWTGQDVA